MKHNIDLHSRIHSWENLELAYRRARRGKRSGEPVADFELRLEDNLIELQDELRTQSYAPGPYQSFYIHEPKRRLISAAPFRDRVVHHALCNVIEPLFERRFIFDSYANRVGKGTHRALDRCQKFARQYPFVLQLDVVQFFPSIDHALLRAALSKVIPDLRVLRLCDAILASGEGVQAEEYQMVFFPGDDLLAVLRPRGLPIGNLTSQFWANVFLDELDQFVKRELKCPAYVRYVDDLLLFAEEKRRLWSWRESIIDFLGRLRLTVHAERAHPRPVNDGIPFLGFTVFPTHRRLKARKAVSFRRKLKGMKAAVERGEMEPSALEASIRGWVNHVRYGDTWGLRRAVLSTDHQGEINGGVTPVRAHVRLPVLAASSYGEFSPTATLRCDAETARRGAGLPGADCGC